MSQPGSLPISGVLLHEYKTGGLTNHLDKASVSHLAHFDTTKITNMGLLDLWAYARKAEVPYMVANINPSNIQNINGNSYRFSLPSAGDTSTYITEVNAPDPTKIGYGQTPFKVTVKGPHLGSFGSQVMIDIHSPYVMTVKNVERKGDQTIYDMVFQGTYTGQDFIPAQFLQPGTRLTKIAGVRSAEFGQDYDSWSSSGKSKKEYLGMLSTGQIQTHYHMTDEACNFFDNEGIVNADMLKESLDTVVEYIGVSGKIESGVKNFSDFVATGGDVSKIGFKYMAMKYDDISMQILAKQNMNMVLWHPGSPAGLDGQDQQYFAPGIWHQMDYSGYKHTYNLENFSADLILTSIRDFESGKVARADYGKERVYKIRTGRGGRILLNQAFEKYLLSANGIVNAKDFKQIEGDNVDGLMINLPYYKGIRIPGEAVLLIDEDESLDNETNTNEFINPRVGSYRLSSYSMIIEDYNTSSSNIKILRNQNLGARRTMMTVVQGDRAHPMFEQSYMGATANLGASLQTGFGAYFRTTPDTGFVVDPTKILKLVPINPLTGAATI